MRNKKGFTLIELLAIIVILAIIAVITVPIILNIIENAKRGAVQNSALGYKDAIHKYYASRLALDLNFNYVDNTYEIVQNGYLSYSDSNNSSNDVLYEISIDGKVPNGGFVEIQRNKVINACIEFDDYAVLISDGSVSETAKGTCLSATEIGAIGESSLEVGTEYSMDPVNEVVKEQTLTITRTGYYKLEVWGASAPDLKYNSKISKGGYGGYATGVMRLTAGTVLYINVGETGVNNNATEGNIVTGGYNGGGDNTSDSWGVASSGGGATHIALKSGVLSSLNNDIDKILIVAGGGGAGGIERNYRYTDGGSGGGYIGGYGTLYGSDISVGVGGSSTSNTYFGAGSTGSGWCGAGGGGGFYGGDYGAGSGGGSGYIGNSKLLDGVMYCYNCGQNSTASIRTYSTTDPEGVSASCPDGYSTNAVSNCAKKGDGSVNITYLGTSYSNITSVNDEFVFPYVKYGTDKEQTMVVPESGYYKLEVWGASGASVKSRGIDSGFGYGGYSSGIINLTKGTTLYINVGGQGSANRGSSGTTIAGGYNGGGAHTSDSWGVGASGGGATHIALVHGQLYQLGDYKGEYDSDAGVYRSSDILIVAGGGGSGGVEKNYRSAAGGHAGGYIGGNGTLYNGTNIAVGTGGTQSTGSAFGGNVAGGGWCGSEGGGFYSGTLGAGGGGGSGYIGNSSLVNKSMYCYDCGESNGVDTMTISTIGDSKDLVNCPDGYSSEAVGRCAKVGNGYAKITYLGQTLN